MEFSCAQARFRQFAEVMTYTNHHHHQSVAFRGMLRRPKPTDSEADLLREQEQFLTSGARSAASVVRRPDKRRGEVGQKGAGEHPVQNGCSQRDVVTIEG